MRATRTWGNRVTDTPKWIRRKKALAAMREDMGTARVGVVRRHYEFRCSGAIAVPSTSAWGMLRSHASVLASCGWQVFLLHGMKGMSAESRSAYPPLMTYRTFGRQQGNTDSGGSFARRAAGRGTSLSRLAPNRLLIKIRDSANRPLATGGS